MRARTLRRILGALGVAVVLAAGGALVALNYITHGYCDRLESRARSAEVQLALESWVDANWTGERIAAESLRWGDGIVPGVRWLAPEFDGSLLSMGPEAHVRLLGVEALPSDEPIAPNVRAIYFAERSRAGVVVQIPEKPRFAAAPEQLTPISDRLSVFCAW